jgi:hypothetical protein
MLGVVIALGLTLAGSEGTPVGAAKSGNCASSSGVKPLIRGLVDRGASPPAADLDATSVNVPWSALEPTSAVLAPDNPIDQAIAASGGCTPLRIRVLAGVNTPAWVLAQTGSISVTNPYDGVTGIAGPFWSDTYGELYDSLEAALAAKYDGDPDIAEFVVSRCALFYPEPFLLGTSVPSNRTALLAAGYSTQLDQNCQQEEIDTAGKDWTYTRIGVSFNPYQVLPATGPPSVDEAYTEQMMAYCRYTLGPRCVLENDSIRDPISGLPSTYAQMYSAMTGASGPIYLTVSNLDVNVTLGAPIAFQTAVDGNVGDFWGTLEWAKENHATSVELPVDGTYPTSGAPETWQTIAEVAQWFEDVPTITADPVTAVQGTSTAGVPVAQVTLDELAAVDTIAGYGDVGSVPFDSVSAVITWPTGASQPGLVSVGAGPPAASATCADERWCDVVVYSGGYTFPEEPGSGLAAVAVAVAAGLTVYTPDDGSDIAASVPVTVTAAPLTIESLSVVPAKASPTVRLAARFEDADPLGVAADYTVQITWGDGSSTSVSATASGSGFAVAASHRYKHAGRELVTLTILDTGGATASQREAITVR